MHPTSKSPEALLVRELVPALQGNPAAAAACLKLQAGLTGKRATTQADSHVNPRVLLLALRAAWHSG